MVVVHLVAYGVLLVLDWTHTCFKIVSAFGPDPKLTSQTKPPKDTFMVLMEAFKVWGFLGFVVVFYVKEKHGCNFPVGEFSVGWQMGFKISFDISSLIVTTKVGMIKMGSVWAYNSNSQCTESNR